LLVCPSRQKSAPISLDEDGEDDDDRDDKNPDGEDDSEGDNSEDDNDLSGLNSALLQRKISSEEKSFVFLFRVIRKWMLSIF
jgi:hypothetical protein